MKGSMCVAAVFILLVFFPAVISARHIGRSLTHDGHGNSPQSVTREGIGAKPNYYWERKPMKRKGADTLQIAGSSLPDCSHACGSCSPCKLVMVSFVCSSLEEAETCPMAYKCMCKNKSYPVP
ncbi:hypothetical protein CFOL_v3_25351 [Cephalotus follicularis]|uniref:Epidermal patterning factor-like protein n=1 Tax=Cephalotus follicularis TaxID=3775 RepID=A0A1Q3CPB3_CEPFO|nr:hypothetical protein CFOL_v3_25351 [Cephalotus follicularis]